MFGGTVNLTHRGRVSSSLKSFVHGSFVWKPAFEGTYGRIYVDGAPVEAQHLIGEDGREYSFVEVEMEFGRQAEASPVID